jgi:hypothetical protein
MLHCNSRLAARWAIFLDTLEIPFEHEPEFYDEDGTLYVPTFWLPWHRYWLEVTELKPVTRSVVHEKIEQFFMVDAAPWGFILWGDLPAAKKADDAYSGILALADWADGRTYSWRECLGCHQVGISFMGQWLEECTCTNKGPYDTRSSRLLEPYIRASSTYL